MGVFTITFAFLTATFISFVMRRAVPSQSKRSEIPLANPGFLFEPRLLRRLRWGFKAHDVLQKAYDQYNGSVYRIDRGDTELVVIPLDMVREFNSLPETVLNSRMAHSYNLLGHITGINVVRQSALYTRIIMKKLTPALPRLTERLQECIGLELDEKLRRTSEEWTPIKILDTTARCAGRAYSLLSIGAPLCDDPEYIHMVTEQTKLVFAMVLLLRFVPNALQSALVWLLPFKWTFERHMKRFEALLVPEIKRLQEPQQKIRGDNMLSWAVQCAQTEVEHDPKVLTKLHAATASGATHSVAVHTANVLFDLACNAELLEQLREEIRQKRAENGGIWTYGTYGELVKLDSVLKESGRVHPMSMPVYSRQLLVDYTMSNGMKLRKGQIICLSGISIQRDPNIFPKAATYYGLRAYDEGREEGKSYLFRQVDRYLFWGAGRYACPGRYLADLETKIMLVKLLAEYDFKLPKDGISRRISLHDFGFMDHSATLMVRRRMSGCGTGY